MKNISRRDSLRMLGGAGMVAALGGLGLSAQAAGIKPDASSVLIVVEKHKVFHDKQLPLPCKG